MLQQLQPVVTEAAGELEAQRRHAVASFLAQPADAREPDDLTMTMQATSIH
jgi:hypothetical protein